MQSLHRAVPDWLQQVADAQPSAQKLREKYQDCLPGTDLLAGIAVFVVVAFCCQCLVRLSVPPGITGWAQDNHCCDTCAYDGIEKLPYAYIMCAMCQPDWMRR